LDAPSSDNLLAKLYTGKIVRAQTSSAIVLSPARILLKATYKLIMVFSHGMSIKK